MQNLFTTSLCQYAVIQGTGKIRQFYLFCFTCSVGRGHTQAPLVMYERVYTVALNPISFGMGYDRL